MEINDLIRFDIKTPIGSLVAIASEQNLVSLSFKENSSYINVKYSQNQLTQDLQNQIYDYFNGRLIKFNIPIYQAGTEFEMLVWNYLKKIPFGKTISYKEQAVNIYKEKAFRAVANANAKNNILILVPCHRVIKSDKSIGGYSCGDNIKQTLLNHEKYVCNNTLLHLNNNF